MRDYALVLLPKAILVCQDAGRFARCTEFTMGHMEPTSASVHTRQNQAGMLGAWCHICCIVVQDHNRPCSHKLSFLTQKLHTLFICNSTADSESWFRKFFEVSSVPHCLSAWLSNLSAHAGTSNDDNSNAGNNDSGNSNAGNSNVVNDIQLPSWIGT